MTGALRRRSVGNFVFPAVVFVAVVAGFLAARDGRDPGFWVFLLVLAGWVITLCLHEFAHAVVSLAGGDNSVQARGYLTLNPLRYVNIGYSLLIPLVLLAVGGIPLPGGAVLVEPHRLRRRYFASLVSAAGPATNLLAGIVLTLVAAGLTTGGIPDNGFAAGLAFLAVLQFVTAILNVLPIPGFDGFGIISPYLSPQTKQSLAPIAPWAPLIVFALIWGVPELSDYLFRPAEWLFQQFGGSTLASSLGQYLFKFWDR